MVQPDHSKRRGISGLCTFSALCLTCCASSTLILVEWRNVGASPGSASCASFSAFCSACSALASSDNGCLARVVGAFLVPGGFNGLCLHRTIHVEQYVRLLSQNFAASLTALAASHIQPDLPCHPDFPLILLLVVTFRLLQSLQDQFRRWCSVLA